MNSQIPAPYVGPRTFRETERYRFFGRDGEARDLLALVVSERLVVFYAQSGAGKSSLVNTCLIPDLRKRGYEILTGRLVGDAPDGMQPANIFVFNLLRSLAPKQRDSASLLSQTITGFMLQRGKAPLAANQPSDEVEADSVALIIDQFEEIFSTHDDEWEKRADFFQQLAQALQEEPYLSIVLVMREDFIASLDPYTSYMPGRFRRRYYMQRLEHDAALEAIREPVAKIRPFDDGVAERLVDDLSGIKIQIPGEEPVTQPGQYVEAVQLQVACLRLWKTLDPGTTITHADLDKLGKVDLALEEHYADRVREVAARKDVGERLIREWFGSKLITPNGARNMVLRDTRSVAGQLRDDVIRELLGDLVRMEQRGAASFYELTHDRLVEPILSNNRKWFQKIFDRSSVLQQKSTLWAEQNKNETLLSTDDALVELEQYAGKFPDEVSDLVREYLEASREKQKQLDDHREAEREIQRQKLEAAENLAREQQRSAQQQKEANLQIQKALRGTRRVALFASLFLILAIAFGIQSNRNQRITQRQVLLNASSIEFQKDERLGTMLAYQALKQFGDFGEVEQAVANTLFDMNERVKAQSPFLIPTTINAVGSMALNPGDGGHTLAAGYTDGTIYLMDMTKLSPSGDPLSGHTANVTGLAFSLDGKYLVSGSGDYTARVWDAATGDEIARMTHDNYVSSVAFSPDGKYVISGSYDYTARVWDAATGDEIARMTHDNSVTSVAFSPDGKYVVSGSADSTVRVWDAATGQEIARMAHGGPVASVAFSLDGKYVASGSADNTARVWETATGQEIAYMAHDGTVNSVAFSPDGQYVVSGGFDNTSRVWEAATGQEIARMTHDNSVISVAFSPDGKYVATGSYDTTARVWEAATGQEIARMVHGSVVTSIAFSPDSTTLVSSSNAASDIMVLDIATGGRRGSIPLPVQPGKIRVAAMSISPRGEIQAISDASLIIWKSENRPLDRLDFHAENPIQSLESINQLNLITGQISAVSADGKYRIAAVNNLAQIIEVATENEEHVVAEVRHGGSAYRVTAVAFSTDGNYVASADNNFTIRIWESKTRDLIAQISSEKEYGEPVSLSFSPDASRIVIAFSDEQSTVEVWDIETRQKILVIARRQSEPLSYTLAGSTGLFDSKEAEITEPGQEQAELVGNPVADVAYLENGLFILYYNGSVDHWDIWPSRADLEAEALSICGPCEMTSNQREKYGLYTWPMRVHDYSGYLLTLFLVLMYGFGARRIYSTSIKGPETEDQNAEAGFTWKKFLSASAQGMALTLLGLLSWGITGLIETIVYSDYARSPHDSVPVFLLLLLPLGLWAGGTYSHLTRFQSGKYSRSKRALIGMLAGFLAGLVSGLLGYITLGYLVSRDLASLLSDTETLSTVLFAVGGAAGLMSLIGSLAYIFLLRTESEMGRITSNGQLVLLQLFLGVGMFFVEKRGSRRWIYPVVLLAMVGFGLLVPPLDLDYNFLGGDIIDDSSAGNLSRFGLFIHLLGLVDLWRSMRNRNQATASRSLLGALGSHFFLGLGLFYLGSKSLRRWVYPVAVLFVLIGFVDLDYLLLTFDIMPDHTASTLGAIALVVHIFGLIDTWWSFRKNSAQNDFGQSEMINKQVPVNSFSQSTVETWLESWWKRGLLTLVFGLISGIVLSYLDQSAMDWKSFSTIAVISLVLGVFGLLFYPHRTSYILLALLVVVGTIVWFLVVNTFFPALWFSLGSAIIVGAIISRVLHAMKKI